MTHWLLYFAIFLQVVTALFHGFAAKRTFREWARLRALNHIIWAYSKELIEKGVTLPPRCVMCCQILPRHVDVCMMADEYERRGVPVSRIKYYPKGEHPPHPKEEEPPPHA